MNAFFIGYWGANEGLSQATIYPHLKILCEHELVDHVTYFSIERRKEAAFQVPVHPKLKHYPLFIEPYKNRLLNKVFGFLLSRRILLKQAKRVKPDLVICRTALAGQLGYFLKRRLAIPFVVESLEPHNEYMIESGIWKAAGVSDRIYKKWERQQINAAIFLLPVTFNYQERLKREGVSEEKMMVMPCAVDADLFRFDQEMRTRMRRQLNIPPETTVGIYVGKFGGIYYKEEAFELFEKTARHFQDFHLLILTPQDDVAEELARIYLSGVKCTVLCVAHSEVPGYLSAADLAFATYKPGPSKEYLSPIKIGEYWAAGLPVLITSGVGDESLFLEPDGGGAKFEMNSESIKLAVEKVEKLIGKREPIAGLAAKYRSFQTVKSTYETIISSWSEKK